MKLGIREKIIRLRTRYYSWVYNIKFGTGSKVLGKCEFVSNGKITFGKNCTICAWSCFREYGGFIKIGDNCSINSFCHISGNGGVSIGNNVLIATQCVIISANHNFDDCSIPIAKQGETRKPIIIEDDCWLGAGCKILSGVRIGRGSVIGAGSVVVRDVEPYSVIVGVPGKCIKNRIEGE